MDETLAFAGYAQRQAHVLHEHSFIATLGSEVAFTNEAEAH